MTATPTIPASPPYPVGRLAPSPTGALHLGNARTFLIAWLSIRSRGGRLRLRIEDLDHPKVKPEATRQALDDLRWLGLDWDGPAVVQSARIPMYRAALAALETQGMVYPCTCSRSDVEAAQSAPHAADHGPRYAGLCAAVGRSFAEAARHLPAGRLPAWRFRTPDRTVVFQDGFAGPQVDNVHRTAGDFVLARHPDGAGYMLAVVVDDADMGVTEILRGDDLIPATPRQVLLQEALGLPRPTYVHVPLVVSEDGRRLAKRHGDTRLSTLRGQGLAPEKVVGLLAWWCGWAEWGEHLSATDLLSRYALSQLPRTPVVLTAPVRDYLGIA